MTKTTGNRPPAARCRNICRHLMLTTVAASALLAAPVAFAADAAKSVGLEEITVTARKRTENLQNAPVSVTALTANTLKAMSVDSFNELTSVAPNIEINGGIPNGGGSAAQVYLRGVGQDDYSFPNEPGVGLYIDGVYMTRTAGGDFGFMDIERIEVLRGPQGTLYGKNTIGGAIKIVTKKPNGETGGEAGITLGSYDRLDFYANAQFPISDKVFAKIAGSSRNRNGLGHNLIGQDLGNENKDAVRGTIRAIPNENLEIIITADHSKQKQNGPAGSMVYFEKNAANAGGIDLVNGFLAAPVAAQYHLAAPYNQYGAAFMKTIAANGHDVYNSWGTVETRDWATIYGVSAAIDWKSENVDVKSITAYRHNDIDIRRDSEHTPYNVVQVNNPEKTSQLSQEFQLSGVAAEKKLNWLVGLYGVRERGTSQLYAPLLSGLYQAIGYDLTALIDTDYKAYSLAGFGEATYYVTPDLGFTIGARVTHDDKKYTYGMIRPESGVVALAPTELKSKWSEFLPKAGIEYHVNQDVMTYANVSRGYKAGGYNSRALSGNPPHSYDPEFITSYEVGFKSKWAENRVTLNAAAFYNDYSDIQLLSIVNLGGGNVETVIKNAGKGRITGGEVEITALPDPRLLLTASGGYIHTKYTNISQDTQDAGILLSNKFANAPKLSLVFSAQYTAPLGNLGELVLRGDASHKSSDFHDAANTPQLMSDAFWTLNARTTFIPPKDNFELAFFVTNITDKIHVTNGVSVMGLGYVEAYYSRPREWGGEFKVNF